MRCAWSCAGTNRPTRLTGESWGGVRPHNVRRKVEAEAGAVPLHLSVEHFSGEPAGGVSAFLAKGEGQRLGTLFVGTLMLTCLQTPNVRMGAVATGSGGSS